MYAVRISIFLLLVVFVAARSSRGMAVADDVDASSRECKAERDTLINACKPVMYMNLPSAYCCQLLRVIRIGCVCAIITPQMAVLINVNRAIRVIQGCGRPVPRHYKCGSITTP